MFMPCSRRQVAIALASAAAGIAILGSGCGRHTAGAGSPENAVRVDAINFGQVGAASVPEWVQVDSAVMEFKAPESMPILEVVLSPPSDGGLNLLADRLGVGPSRNTAAREGVFALTDGKYELEVVHPGDINCFTMVASSFADGSYEEQMQGLQSNMLPSASEARALADKLLANAGFSDGLVYAGTGTKTGYREVTSSGIVETIPTSLAVTYRPQVGPGMIVEGPGAKVVVVLGADGKLLSLMHWTQQTKIGPEIPVRPVADALEDLRAGMGAPPSEIPRRAKVESVRLAYWAEPLPYQSSTWKPVFVFGVTDADEKAAPVQGWVVSALRGR